MNIPVPLPALGEAVESATISHWLKSLGDEVVEGEPLVEVSTDKVDTEIESPTAGVLVEIRSETDSVVHVGDVIAILATGADTAAEPDHADTAERRDETGASTPPDPGVLTPPPTLSTPAQATQVAQPAVAASASPPLLVSQVPVSAPPRSYETTTGPTAEVASQDATPELRGTTQPMTRLRKTIATRMLESLQTSAQLTTIVEVDVTEVGRLRRQHNLELTQRQGIKLSYLSFIAAAAVAALRTYPQLNSRVDAEAGTVTYPPAEHLGIAVDTAKGLFVPVIRDAGSLNVSELAQRIADVAARTRDGSIAVDELSGGTFTITNTGSRGALMDTPIINQPQVAILGAGAVVRRPVILGQEGYDESIAVRSMVYLSLTYDHRVVDGADAARYLTAIKSHLEHGSFDV